MKKILYALIIATALFSCQKVIDVDLNDSNPQIVIEANYSAEDSTVLVRISMTSSFFDSEPSPVVDDAVVTISNASGSSISIPYIGDGFYKLENYLPDFDSKYVLSVSNNGTTYLAECFLPAPVQLEPISYDSIPSFFGNEGGFVPYLNYYDPVGIVNHYQIVLSKNGDVWDGLTQFFTQDDLFTDGNYIERPLFGQEFYNTGDTIGMELRSIDEVIYNYINEAQSIAGASSSAAPANPGNNWNNGALGYFSAYSSSRQSVVIQ